MALWMSENSEINFLDGKLFASLLDNFLCRLKSLLCQILFPAIVNLILILIYLFNVI